FVAMAIEGEPPARQPLPMTICASEEYWPQPGVPSIALWQPSAWLRHLRHTCAACDRRCASRCASPHGKQRRLSSGRAYLPCLCRAAIVFIALANPAFLACAPPFANPALIFLGVALPKD